MTEYFSRERKLMELTVFNTLYRSLVDPTGGMKSGAAHWLRCFHLLGSLTNGGDRAGQEI